MRSTIASALVFVSVGLVGLVSVTACRKDPAVAPQPGQVITGYDPNGNPIYGYPPAPYPSPGYTQPYPTPYPQPYPTPGGPYPQPPATAANPLSPPCQSDAACLTFRCNMQTQHCAIPCASGADCQPGNGCVAGACIPGAPQ